MNTARPHANLRRGVILPVVLFVLVLIGLLAAMFSFRVHADLAAAQAMSFRLQTRLAAEAGVERVKLLLRTARFDRGIWYSNPDLFNRVIVSAFGRDSQTAGTTEEFDENFVYRFSIVADDPTDDKDFVRFGITDEAAKLNLNEAAKSHPEALLTLVTAAVGESKDSDPQLIVDAIMDWYDGDADPRGEEPDTEGDFYRQLENPYRIKNGPFDSVEELLLVKGVTPLVLYGEDYDRNGLLSENERDGDRAFPPDNQDDILNRGLYPYLTVISTENNVSNRNRPRVYLLGAEATVRAELEAMFPDDADVVDFIISAVKKPPGGGQQGGGGGQQGGGGGQQGGGQQGGGQQGGGQQGGGGGPQGGGQQGGGGGQQGGGQQGGDQQGGGAQGGGPQGGRGGQGGAGAAQGGGKQPKSGSPPNQKSREAAPQPDNGLPVTNEGKLGTQMQRRDPPSGGQPAGGGAQGGPKGGGGQPPGSGSPQGGDGGADPGDGSGVPGDGTGDEIGGEEDGDEISQDGGDGSGDPQGGGGGSGDGGESGSQIKSPAGLLLPRTVDGQVIESPLSAEQLAVLMDETTTIAPQQRTIPGLININTAPRLVLECVDGLSSEQIDVILAKRDRLDPLTSSTTAWLYSEGVLDAATYAKVAPQITARGQQFTIESVGYADHIGMVTRLQVVVDMNGPIAQTISYRDISNLGGAYPIREADKEKMRGR